MKLIIHGGFFSESKTNQEVKQAKQEALREIVKLGYKYLESHTAVETVVYTVCLLEDCDLFNAGTGSQIQSDGKIRMSASLMDGKTMQFSGVINIESVKNPISVAEKLLRMTDKVLAGKGAQEFARHQGFPFYDPETPQRRHEYEKKLSDSIPGRVSDSATAAGNYVNQVAGISCTGVGEDIVSGAVAPRIVTRVTDGMSLQMATIKTLDELKPFDGFAGVIGISAKGEVYYADTHPYMVWAYYDGKPEVFS
jgi:L-asparaginase